VELRKKKSNVEVGAWLSIGVYVVLSCIKLVIGYYTDSRALFADGLNNATDILASIAILVGFKISKRPADEDHKYGHSRAETVASMIASFIMVLVGVEVLISSAEQFITGDTPTPDMIAAWTALLCAGVMFAVYIFNMKLSRSTGSLALKAVAVDNRSDALVSIGSFVGIIGSVVGLIWLDVVTAFIVGLIICITGWNIFKESTHRLTDGFDQDELDKYHAVIDTITGVETVKEIKGRMHGDHVFLDLVIEVDPQLSVYESHEITEEIENELKRQFNIEHVHVHIEPS